MHPDPGFRKSVREKYSRTGEIWDVMDRWHTTVQREIKQAAGRLNRIHPDPYGLLLDLGSGGISQSVPYQSYVHIDIALERLRDVPTGICADAQLLP